jgi:cytoplasmic iron level regulating protein YaaA (DUF328/UPF0246 family)
MKTKAFLENFKGHDIVAIWEVDDAGNKVGKYPIISFGAKKAEAILANIDVVKQFVVSAS